MAPRESSGAPPESAERKLTMVASALPVADAPAFSPGDFGVVGVFDVDWLLEPRFTRLLDTMAASPGAFSGVRFFGALNSGERESVFPRGSGGVWRDPAGPIDFTVTLEALGALVARGLVPFVNLSFFPAAVSPSPIEPPATFERWKTLVSAFLDAAVGRFGSAEIARWWFEVWNEPNMPPFWSGSFEDYLNLYRATSETVVRSGRSIQLGGPALAYLPNEGPALMQRFLDFLRDEPGMKCDFISFHRKGIWVAEESEPEIGPVLQAARMVAEAVIRLIPGRARGLAIVNDEADMKVGFDTPYEPRMTQQFPSWLTALAVTHERLNGDYAAEGMRFIAASDDANQQLVRAPFDGRRSVATIGSESPNDLVKLPVYGFYEMLRLLGDRRGRLLGSLPVPELFHLLTVADTHIGALFTAYDARANREVWRIAYVVRDIPWHRVNVAQFRIDETHGNAFTAAGSRLSATPDSEALRHAMRLAQELAVGAPIRRGIAASRGEVRESVTLPNFATVLLWITPFVPNRPASPRWIDLRAEGEGVVLRWTPNAEPFFYAYELVRKPEGSPPVVVSPPSLRAAIWTDASPTPGVYAYGVRAVTASGVKSELVWSRSIRI